MCAESILCTDSTVQGALIKGKICEKLIFDCTTVYNIYIHNF
jgi:hypothetical protein